MNIAEKNLEVLKDRYPAIHRNVISELEKKEESFEDKVSHIQAKDGESALCIERKGKITRLNSAYRPLEEAKKWSEKYEFTNLCSVIEMFGLGNGICTQEMLNRMQEDDIMILYEPSLAVFLYSVQNFDLTSLLENRQVLLFVKGCNEEAMKFHLVEIVNWYNIQYQYIVIHPQYDKLFDQELLHFLKELKENNEVVEVNNNTDAFQGKVIVDNICSNIKHLAHFNAIQHISEKISKDIPAIIVAAGPSLQKNIEVLAQAKGKAVIFAVDTAVRYLEKYGIEPDFIVTIDPNKGRFHFRCDYAKNTPIISKLESLPFALEENESRKIFYSPHMYGEELLKETGLKLDGYTSGGSVATAAFSICLAMKFKRIILVGQDLAYDGEYTHIGDRKENRAVGMGLREVEGTNGGMVRTRYDWYIYLCWFANSILEHPETECINATEGGAMIKGTHAMKLQDAIDAYCKETIDVASLVKNLDYSLSSEKVLELSKHLHDDYDVMMKIKLKSAEILGNINKIIMQYKKAGSLTNREQSYMDKISQSGEWIEAQRVYLLIDTYMRSFAMSQMGDIYQVESDEYTNTLKTFEHIKEFYKAVLDAINEIKPKFETAIAEYDTAARERA
ncbi:MAG: motility associated factor glycosyltransferase family protein [Lachnospiraceae bacterium]|nr:motility associated factor glycosyltransferase family protein [Lachnospiraceae bacterium]